MELLVAKDGSPRLGTGGEDRDDAVASRGPSCLGASSLHATSFCGEHVGPNATACRLDTIQLLFVACLFSFGIGFSVCTSTRPDGVCGCFTAIAQQSRILVPGGRLA